VSQLDDTDQGERGRFRGASVQARTGVVVQARTGGGVTPDRGGPGDLQAPATTRVGPAGGPGRGLRTTLALLAVGLVLVVAKPWDMLAPPSSSPGREGAAISSPAPGSSPTLGPDDWADLSPRVACLAGSTWRAVVDEVDGPTASRAWTRLDVAPATGPTDPSIVRVRVYAAFVPRIGFCVPLAGAAPAIGGGAGGGGAGGGGAGGGGAGGGGAEPAPFGVHAWQLIPGAGVPGAWTAAEIHPLPVPDGAPADRGALYLPPAPGMPGAGIVTRPGRTGSGANPAGASPGSTSTADASLGSTPPAGDATPSLPAGWSPDGVSWPPATYVFRVELSATAPGGPAVTWFAIDLRGPWTGPSDVPEPTPASSGPAPDPTRGSSPAP
jgi:hypothetical protein